MKTTCSLLIIRGLYDFTDVNYRLHQRRSMSEQELTAETAEEVVETVRYDNAVVLSDDTFYNMMDDARARQAKNRDIDLPMVALRTLTSSLYTLGKLGWTKEELYREVDDYLDMAVNTKKKMHRKTRNS